MSEQSVVNFLKHQAFLADINHNMMLDQNATMEVKLKFFLEQTAPYLYDLCIKHENFFTQILYQNPLELANNELEALKKIDIDFINEDIFLQKLRLAKQKISLLLAIAQILKTLPLRKILSLHSHSHDMFIQHAFFYATCKELKVNIGSQNFCNCGLTVFGLGKLGGYELNFSSDVDLIIFFDEEKFEANKNKTAQISAVNIVKNAIRYLQHQTQDGFITRIDLRLRPDPSSTKIAISFASALDYYETRGSHWERFALMKMRFIAGDRNCAEDFIKKLDPFIWRPYLDYKALSEIRDLKLEITKAKTAYTVPVHSNDLLGYNVKLGIGGIREIEFIVQSLQIIYGSRNAELKHPSTLNALMRLKKFSYISKEQYSYFFQSYLFLRRIENTIQFRYNRQEHCLPNSLDELKRIGLLCGYENQVEFEKQVIVVLSFINQEFQSLFPNHNSNESKFPTDEVSSIQENNKKTIEAFDIQNDIIDKNILKHMIKKIQGNENIIQSTQENINIFLKNLSNMIDHSKAPNELISILIYNKNITSLLFEIIQINSQLTQIISDHPHVLDLIIYDGFDSSHYDPKSLQQRSQRYVNAKTSIEEKIDALKIFNREEKFRIGLGAVLGIYSLTEIPIFFSHLAQTILDHAMTIAQTIIYNDYGNMTNNDVILIALGRLGTNDMSMQSDLDIIFIYHSELKDIYSDGKKSIHISTYNIRLVQKLIAIITTLTKEGSLYDIDMRLRPSGSKGPIAVSFDNYITYHQNEAQVWEHMALTKARVILGSPHLIEEFHQQKNKLLKLKLSRNDLLIEIIKMRNYIHQERSIFHNLDIKHGEGGLIDIEFLYQFFVLCHANFKLHKADNFVTFLTKLFIEFNIKTDAAFIKATWQVFLKLFHLTRIILAKNKSFENMDDNMKFYLAKKLGIEKIIDLENRLSNDRMHIKMIFDKLMTKLNYDFHDSSKSGIFS